MKKYIGILGIFSLYAYVYSSTNYHDIEKRYGKVINEAYRFVDQKHAIQKKLKNTHTYVRKIQQQHNNQYSPRKPRNKNRDHK